MTVGRRALTRTRVAGPCAARQRCRASARPVASRSERVPFYLLIALIFVYTRLPVLLGDPLRAHARGRPVPHAGAVHPARSDARPLPARASRAASSCGPCSTRRSSPVPSRSLSLVDRLARGVRARALPVPRPHRDALPDALDDDLPADRDPRRALHDDQPVRALQQPRRARLQLHDLHAAVHGLDPHRVHGGPPEGPRGGRLRGRRLARPDLLPRHAAARRARHSSPTGLLAFIAAWNEFLFALSFTQSPDKYTVPVAITSFTGESGSAFRPSLGSDHGRDGRRDACR